METTAASAVREPAALRRTMASFMGYILNVGKAKIAPPAGYRGVRAVIGAACFAIGSVLVAPRRGTVVA
jgi:hypothetical protein